MNWLSRLFKGGGLSKDLDPAVAARIAQWQQLPVTDLLAPHGATRYVVVDVETSGLNMAKDRLIAIGAVAVTGGLIDFQDSFEVILRQDEVSATDNIILHGIGATAQREGVEPQQALLDFLQFVGNAPLVAYHAVFDQTMIARAMEDVLGLKFSPFWLDLAWLAPEIFKDRIDSHIGLDPWLQLFGIENIQRHNAVSDCLATAMFLQALLAKASVLGKDTPDALAKVEKARRWLRRSG